MTIQEALDHFDVTYNDPDGYQYEELADAGVRLAENVAFASDRPEAD